MNPLECGAFNGQTTLFFHNGTDPHCIHPVVQTRKLGKGPLGRNQRSFHFTGAWTPVKCKMEVFKERHCGRGLNIKTKWCTVAKNPASQYFSHDVTGLDFSHSFFLFKFHSLTHYLGMFLSVENIIITLRLLNSKSNFENT